MLFGRLELRRTSLKLIPVFVDFLQNCSDEPYLSSFLQKEQEGSSWQSLAASCHFVAESLLVMGDVVLVISGTYFV